jgi:hypothetical protein
MSVPRSRTKAFRSVGESRAGLRHRRAEQTPANGSSPDWDAVEELIALLAKTHATFTSTLSDENWISAYEPGRRLMLEAGSRSSWVQVEHVRTCWETFERRGRICRRDVLEPGRHSAFMIALFAQLPGVREEPGDEPSLVLAPAHAVSRGG